MDFDIFKFKDFVNTATAKAISERRHTLLKLIDGDTLYALSLWPQDMKLIFLKKTYLQPGMLQIITVSCGKWMSTLFCCRMDNDIMLLEQKQDRSLA